MRGYRLTEKAEEDVDSLTLYTIENFGVQALDRYLHLVDTGILKLCEDPFRLGVQEFEGDILRYHLMRCRNYAATKTGTVRQPRHVIYFRLANDGAVEIIRMLHDSMDPERHLSDE